ncbi:MAG: helix-turn-helix domain-containing protein [Oscillospiraceae bacterium]|jgi:transcriptional regulator with XRE-family HTH domain|nr:helix-turn-helix domain-containing protein [Oscillospiraceae bacterium]
MENGSDRFGFIIKSARNAKHLTREQVAATLNISIRHLGAVENEHQNPSYELLYRIVQELDISADSIFHPELSSECVTIKSCNCCQCDRQNDV